MTARRSGTDRRRATGARAAHVMLRRRNVLRGCVCWGFAGLLWPAHAAAIRGDPAAPIAALAAILGDIAPLRHVGLLYLGSHAAEADERWLHKALFGAASPQTTTAVAQSIAAARRRDLGACDMAIVDGWLMTRSEARLCALVALGLAPA